MNIFWSVLGLLGLAGLGLLCYAARVAIIAVARDRSWHPGDDLPDVPPDSELGRRRRDRG